MSYCINPECPQPKNLKNAKVCQACGSSLLLRDRYLVLKILGQGGFGATFLAAQVTLPGKPTCVIKQLRPSTTSPGFVEMARELFRREAETLGRLGSHPQVPSLLDYFEDNRHFYLIQEYISGANLQQIVKRKGRLSETEVKQFLSEILPMLAHIHSQQVIHRDIKPANLIRREVDGKLVLIDFGAVKTQVNAAMATHHSEQGALTSFAVGTPGFASPEQMAMRPVYASDIYSLGATCLYLLTGKSPKDLDYNPATGTMNWRKYVKVSDHFASVLEKMLETGVRDRYQSAEEVLRALEIEPHLDSLSQGLARQPQPNSEPPQSEPYVSPQTARLAKMIRERRSRRDPQTNRLSSLGGRDPSGIRRITTTTTTKTQGTQGARTRGTSRKLEAQEVLATYCKGRRDFSGHDLRGLELPNANLAGGIFRASNLHKINLRKAELAKADFGKANLTQSILREAKLGGAYLSYANLEGADLRGADLTLANLHQANLKGANLCGTDLTNATITEEQLSHAKTNWATIFPNGKRAFW